MSGNMGSEPVSVAMVAYNEEKRIEKILLEFYNGLFLKLPKGSEFIIYLDGPTDKTPEIVRRLAKRRKMKVIVGKKNLGYTGAMTAALRVTKKPFVFYSDSSGKHRARDFWKLYPLREKYDVVNGCRSSRTDPFIRRTLTLGSRILVSSFFFISFHDFNTGYKLMRKEALQKVLPRCHCARESMFFSTEFLVRAMKMGFTVKDVPVKCQTRPGKMKGFADRKLLIMILRSFKTLFSLRWELWFRGAR